ncbi:YopX family protein [Qingrenia yutianensis]|uniref:YopX protein domain-containing protein n=1 Tax=Qingrenia yutianensis TaxID=2763676 RepID=A0A926FA58_9FIRM|nr:YopX family protein [Qingrenia yutianensis]MBC8597551.1 hypothetical protein [Qingrenia yutianensis]
MNNRYICRGKRKDNGEWIEGFYACQSNHSCIASTLKYQHFIYKDVCMDIGLGGLADFEVIPETVGQCSGVPDKNGKLMFVGDVVNALFDFEMPIKSVCVFKDGSFGLLAKQHGVEHFHAFTSICNVKYEVIGNIHDNDLLEAER